MDLIDRVNLIIEENKKITKAKVANAIEMPAPNFSDILNRKGTRKFSAENVLNMAIYFKKTTDFLYGLEDENESIKFIPIIGLAHCGVPQEYDLNGFDLIPVLKEEYQEGMYAVRAEGDSMLPKISDNDILYCTHNSYIDSGVIVHYSYNGESGIRKYKIDEDNIISLIPLNMSDDKEYDITTITKENQSSLITSKVIGLYRNF